MIVLHKTNVLGVVCEFNDMSNNACASKLMSLGYCAASQLDIAKKKIHLQAIICTSTV